MPHSGWRSWASLSALVPDLACDTGGPSVIGVSRRYSASDSGQPKRAGAAERLPLTVRRREVDSACISCDGDGMTVRVLLVAVAVVGAALASASAPLGVGAQPSGPLGAETQRSSR